jgi:phosphoribosylanthranilate isomerase
MTVRVKICGLKDRENLDAAIAGGAAYVGFVFHKKSPRNIEIADAAELAASVPAGVCKVALTADADDDAIAAILESVPIDMLQLHGNETPDRVTEIKSRFGLPVMKAVGLGGAADIAELVRFSKVADQILVDAKPPKGAANRGGTGHTIDWTLLSGRRWPVPWMLAGGLTAENVADAIRITGAQQVDVSSGVERKRGAKDPEKVREFLDTVLKGSGEPQASS